MRDEGGEGGDRGDGGEGGEGGEECPLIQSIHERADTTHTHTHTHRHRYLCEVFSNAVSEKAPQAHL